MVKAEIVKINDVCLRNGVERMLSFSDSIIDCRFEYYYLMRAQGDEEIESFILKAASVGDISERFGQMNLLADTISGHILFFSNNTIDAYVGERGENKVMKIVGDKHSKEYDVLDITFDGCEKTAWKFYYRNNKVYVTNVQNYRITLYDWLIFAKDTCCIDNPLQYQIEFIEETPDD